MQPMRKYMQPAVQAVEHGQYKEVPYLSDQQCRQVRVRVSICLRTESRKPLSWASRAQAMEEYSNRAGAANCDPRPLKGPQTHTVPSDRSCTHSGQCCAQA
jgi:hypothetical protein